MRKRSGKFEKIVKLAAAEERRYAEATGAAQQRLNEQVDRLGELSAYRHNYSRDASSSRVTSAAQLKDFQSFLDRLDQAVAAQQQVIRDCEQSLERHRRHWMSKKRRFDSLERVRERNAQLDHPLGVRLDHALEGNVQHALERVRERYQHEERRTAERHAQRVADDRRPAGKRFDGE